MLNELEDAGRPRQPLAGAARTASRVAAKPANPTNPNDPGLRLGRLRPRGALRAAVRDQGRLLASSARRRGRTRGRAANVAPTNIARPAALRDRRRAALRRHLQRRRTAACSRRVRHWLAWNEPNNPSSCSRSTSARGGGWTSQSATRLREDLQRDLRRRPRVTTLGASKVACGVTAPRGNNNPNSARAVGLAARVPAGDEEGRRDEVRRLRAPSVLRLADRDAVDAAAARQARQRRRPRSRSATSAL